MKNKKNRILTAFRLPPKTLELLRRHSKKTSINQTRIVEMALEKFFLLKH
jgi:predicted DNA-binding protein